MFLYYHASIRIQIDICENIMSNVFIFLLIRVQFSNNFFEQFKNLCFNLFSHLIFFTSLSKIRSSKVCGLFSILYVSNYCIVLVWVLSFTLKIWHCWWVVLLFWGSGVRSLRDGAAQPPSGVSGLLEGVFLRVNC